MNVKGIKTEIVIVDVQPADMVIALSRMIHVDELFVSQGDTYSKLVEADGNFFIATYEDKSYHGSPNYEEICRTALSKNEYEAAKGLELLMKIIKEK